MGSAKAPLCINLEDETELDMQRASERMSMVGNSSGAPKGRAIDTTRDGQVSVAGIGHGFR